VLEATLDQLVIQAVKATQEILAITAVAETLGLLDLEAAEVLEVKMEELAV
jgi:hypothetical protein